MRQEAMGKNIIGKDAHADLADSFYLRGFSGDGTPAVIKRYGYDNGSYRLLTSDGSAAFDEMDESHFNAFRKFFFSGERVVHVPGGKGGVYKGFSYSGMNGDMTPCRITVYVKAGHEDKVDITGIMGGDAHLLEHLMPELREMGLAQAAIQPTRAIQEPKEYQQ